MVASVFFLLYVQNVFIFFQYKKKVTEGFAKDCLPLFNNGSKSALNPVIDTVFPFNKVADAHRYMEANKNTGKIILQIRNENTGETLHDEL